MGASMTGTKELLEKALAAIEAVHKAFGAPGDYGYGTREGDALFELYKAAADIFAFASSFDDEVDGEPHHDDLGVDRFAAAMKGKLAKKRAEGFGGWSDPNQCTAQYLSELLRQHAEKGDPVDVGNIAMMLHQRGERISVTRNEGGQAQ